MEEREAYKEIRIRYHRDTEEELLGVIGLYAAKRSGIEVTPVIEEAEHRQLNENLVTMMPAPGNPEQDIPVITKEDLRNFEEGQGKGKGMAGRFFRSFSRSHVIKMPTNQHYFYMDPVSIKPRFASASIEEFTTHYAFRGIRAEKARDLSVALMNDHMYIHQVGDESKKFFQEFCRALYQPEDEK